MSKQDYVLGFIFNPELDRVLLMKKNKGPKGLNDKFIGKLNGVGGKIEVIDQSPLDAMIRECWEETGLNLGASYWTYFCNLRTKYGDVYCFSTLTAQVYNYIQKENEKLEIYTLSPSSGTIDFNYYGYYPRLASVDWLIPMGLNSIRSLDEAKAFIVEELY